MWRTPSQQEALAEFFSRVNSFPVITEWLAFDGAVLRNVAERVGVPVPPKSPIDTLPLARLFHQSPGQRHDEGLPTLWLPPPWCPSADVDEMLGGIVEGCSKTNRHPWE
jgi:hypothetical protein